MILRSRGILQSFVEIVLLERLLWWIWFENIMKMEVPVRWNCNVIKNVLFWKGEHGRRSFL